MCDIHQFNFLATENIMKDEKCGTKTTGCDTKDEKKKEGQCSTQKPHEEKHGDKCGCGCGDKK